MVNFAPVQTTSVAIFMVAAVVVFLMTDRFLLIYAINSLVTILPWQSVAIPFAFVCALFAPYMQLEL